MIASYLIMAKCVDKKIIAVLIDLSGTIHIGDKVTLDAVDALKRLRSSSLKLKFVTNTTKESGCDLKKRLDNLGFDVKSDEIFSSLSAAKSLVKTRNLRPMLLLQPSAKEQFSDVFQKDPNAVLVGLSPDSFNYSTMNEAFRLLLSGAPLIAVHVARYFKEDDGLSLGPGAFVRALEYSAGIQAEIVGKPQKSFFESALKSIGCEPQNAIMIGDDVRDDICGAQEAGMTGILVQTGKYRPLDETKVDIKPDYVVPTFSHAVDLILNKLV